MGDVLRELAGRIVDGKTVGFIGAGASIRSGYPLWGSLLDGLYEQAQAAVTEDLKTRQDGDDLRWLAQYYSTALRGKTDLADAVQEVFNRHHLTGPGSFHDLIARLPIKHFVTTNYDDLVEDACNREAQRRLGRELEIQEKCSTLSGMVDREFSRFLRGLAEDSGTRAVMHLHGALRLRDITLSLADYGDQYMQEAMPDRIYTIFATSTVVFIGSSLTDPDIMSLILRSNFHGEKKTRHYAFLPGGYEHFDNVLKDNYGIEPIRYKVVRHPDGSQDHSDLDLKLTRLLELVEERLLAASTAAEGHTQALAVVKGNALPVTSADVDNDALEAVKDEIRGHANGMVTFSHPDPVESSRLLRTVAIDYRRLPARYRFRRVVFLSPSRLGLFPDHTGPRSVVHSMIGETVRALGHQSLTSTVDVRRNISALRSVLMDAPDACTGRRGEVTLFVIEEADDILDAETGLLNEVVTNLPPGSVVVREFTAEDGSTPWTQRRWRGLWHRVGEALVDSSPTITTTHERLEQVVGRTGNGSDRGRRLLCALSVLANPAPSEELTAMIGMAPFEIEEAAAALAHAGLLETEHPPERTARGVVPPEGGLGRLDVVPYVRWIVLERVLKELPDGSGKSHGDLARRFVRTATQIFEWAEAKMFSLKDWEHDTRQSRHLNMALPNLLTAYEAAEWLVAKQGVVLATPAAADGVIDRARLVEFAVQLAYTLFSLGRWGEAVEYTKYLTEQSEGVDDVTLLAKVQILRSRMLAFTAQGQDDYDQAQSLVTRDFPNLEGGEEHDLLKQRAEIRHGVALLRRRRLGRAKKYLKDAENLFTDVYEAAFPDGSGLAGGLPNDAKLHDAALGVHAEAAEYLVETKFALDFETEPHGEAQPKSDLSLLLETLDRQRYALRKREDRRGIGHHWRLRGDVLLVHKGPAVARRYFGRALVVSYEFRDRLLEAGARLGLARCDRRREEAETAAEIYSALDLPGMMLRAQAIAQTLPEGGASELLRPVDLPRLVLFFGPPSSGRSTALRTTARILTQWGLDPRRFTVEPGDDPDEQVRRYAPPEDEGGSRTPRVEQWAVLGKLGGSAADVLGWSVRHLEASSEAPGTLPELLCVHLTPIRRTERRNWVWPGEELEDGQSEVPWDTAFEQAGAAYVSLNSNVPILDLEDTVRESIAYSFLSIDELLNETRDQWSPPLPWNEQRAAERAAAEV